MAHFQTPTPVKIDQLDLGQIQKDNALSALYDQRLQGMAYENGSRNALNDVLKTNPSATGQNVIADMAARGFGEAGQKYAYNWMNRQHAALQYETDLRKEVSNIIGSVTDEDSKNRAVDYIQSKFPDADFSQYRSMPWQQAREAGNTFALGAAGRVAKDRNDATGAAVGAPAGVDVGLWNNVDMARKADARAAAAADRAAGLYPGQLEQQGATLEHTRASTEALNTKTDIPKIQWAKDMGGMETTPYALGKDGTWTQMPVNKPDTMTPPPAGEDGNVSYSGGARQTQFKSAEEVRAAYRAGKLTKEQARKAIEAGAFQIK
ncbi:MAG: hypothetical protein AB7D27_14640 [Desulfomicrobium sp.]